MYRVRGDTFMPTITKFAIPIPTDKVAEFCQRWRIQELSLFGSVLTEYFHANSDIDILIDFEPPVLYTFRHLDLMQEELEEIFGRSVDIIDKKAIEESPNYIRRRNILDSAQVIYAR
jgi:predicted nucleotidyltransferase